VPIDSRFAGSDNTLYSLINRNLPTESKLVINRPKNVKGSYFQVPGPHLISNEARDMQGRTI
jgi:hypothetical protein